MRGMGKVRGRGITWSGKVHAMMEIQRTGAYENNI